MNISKRKIRIINLKSFISNLVFFFVLLFLLSFFFSCNNNIEPEELKPGRRDYTWEVDTIKTEYVRLMKMWGTSPSNVWAIGHGASGFDETIWHYDGNKWKSDGVWRNIEPWCLYGFSERDIWLGGADGKIWHYDGNDWSENLVYSNSDITLVHFMDIWGDSPNEVYAVGFGDSSNVRIGLMMHYNGIEWHRVYNSAKCFLVKIKRGKKTNSNYYLMGHTINDGVQDTTKLFGYNGKVLKEIYSQPYSKEAKATVCKVGEKIYFNIGDGLYKYENNNFNKFIQNIFANTYTAFGRNENDIFWMMADGITHYNGSDFKYMLNFENKSLSDGIVFKDEVFFVANDFYNNNANNLIYHGVLNK